MHTTVQKAIGFLNNDCGLVHRNVCLSSVFVDGAGEWKLAGVEFMVPHGDSASAPPKSLETLRKYDPPEMGKPAAARKTEKWWVLKVIYIYIVTKTHCDYSSRC